MGAGIHGARARILAAAIFCATTLIGGSCDLSSRPGNFSKPSDTTPASQPRPRPSQTPSTPNTGLQAETNFAVLINRFSQGQAKRTPWAGYWWPYADGGIADAAQLFEAASGQSGAVSWERAHHGPSPGGLNWWGHCNGWAAAAALYPEPREPKSVNGVRFSAADQKALLSEVAMEVDADFFGQRNDDDDESSPSFQDVFPDQFFLVLTNYTGNGLPLVMDRYTGSQVWNQPITGYVHSRVRPNDVLPTDPSAPGVTRVNLTTQLWWARDDVAPDVQTGAFTFKDDDFFESRTLSYEVWLDGPVQFDSTGRITSSGNVLLAKNGKVVTGGAWKATADPLNSHPDYLWVPHKLSPSTEFANPKVDPAWVTSHFAQ